MAKAKQKTGDFPAEFPDQLIGGRKTPEEFFGDGGLFKQIQKALIERALNAEMTHHLGYEAHEDAAGITEDRRNGHTPKTVQTESGPIDLQVPRDRDGDFTPQMVKKGQRGLEGFDEKVI